MARSRYDDDDDDHPRRRRRQDERRGGGPPVGLIVGGVVGGALLVVGIVVAVVATRKPAPTPDAANSAPTPAEVRPGPVAGVGGRASDLPQPPPPKQPPVGTPMPPATPTVTQLAFAGGEDGVVGLLGNDPLGAGELLTVARTKTGEKVGTFTIGPADNCSGYAVTHDGRYAALK